MDERQIEEEVQRFIRVSRICGWIAIVVGGLLFAGVAVRYLTASEKSEIPQVGTLVFCAFLPLIGVIFVLNPKEKLAVTIRGMYRRASEVQERLGGKK